MNNNIINETCKKLFKDNLVRCILASVILFSLIAVTYLSTLFGIFTLFSYIFGCVLPIILLKHRNIVVILLDNIKELCGYSNNYEPKVSECDICDTKQCQRHKLYDIPREPWKGLIIDKDLDEAVESFYSRILNSFVKSWFLLLSHDEDFVQTLKQGLREATCHLIIKIKSLNAAHIITNKLLPLVFEHIEVIQKMLIDGTAMDKLPNGFIQNDRPIHPAVINRKSEIDYLRAVAKSLIPRIFHSENFDSKIFFSLVRELIACWVLLPLMDVISDPNLINLMIITATNKKSTAKVKRSKSISAYRVEFLKNFVTRSDDNVIKRDDTFLTDRSQLYSFMQFLKKEGAVEILSFYLDVDNLNKELQDPKVTTDPAKLSSLYQQSEKLLENYKILWKNNGSPNIPKTCTLTEAHENIKMNLEGKWRKEFHKTPDFYKLVYGSKEIKLIDDNKGLEQTGAVSRFGSKLKDAIRGAIDGAPLEATEVPTVWDALAEPQVSSGNPTIYNSVAQKLRKERGQNLDSFLVTFMQSLEQSTDVGEDVIEIHETKQKHKPQPPGRNLVFGNLFELNKSSRNIHLSSNLSSSSVRGPTQCFLYILDKILDAPKIIVQLIFAFVCISRNTVDSLICQMINKLIRLGLYEPRLSFLIRILEAHLFGPKQPEVSPTELLERQRQARKRMEKIRKGLGNVVDVMQSPSLNKHLMYCAFDVILAELYPEFDDIERSV